MPLGRAVGNALEVREAIAALKGEFNGDLMELCLTIGSSILLLGGMADSEDAARAMARRTIDDGSALERLRAFIRAQGGDERVIDEPDRLPTAPVQLPVMSYITGYVNHMDTEGVGLVSLHLGGGRATKESVIDPAVGVVREKKTGDAVRAGETLAVIHAQDKESAGRAADELRRCYVITKEPPETKPFIKDVLR